MKKNLKIENVFLAMIFTLPLYSLQFIGISLKDFFLLLILGYLLLIYLKHDLHVSRNQFIILILIILFFIFSIFSAGNSPDFINSFRTSISVLNIFLLVFITFIIVNTRRMLSKVIKIIYIMSLIIGLVGISQVLIFELFGLKIGGSFGNPFVFSTSIRATGFFVNPNLYSFFLHLGYSLSFANLIFKGDYRIIYYKFRWLFINHIILTLAIIYSGSKGALLSLIIGSTSLIFLLTLKKKVYPLLMIVLTIPFSWIIYNLGMLINLVFNDNGEANDRIIFWEYALSMFEKRPFFGFGMDSFRDVNNSDLIPHNLYMQTLSENGILGLGILAIIFVYTLVKLLLVLMKSTDKKDTTISLGLFSGLIIMLVHSISLSSLNNIMMWLCISLIGAYYYVYKKEENESFD